MTDYLLIFVLTLLNLPCIFILVWCLHEVMYAFFGDIIAFHSRAYQITSDSMKELYDGDNQHG